MWNSNDGWLVQYSIQLATEKNAGDITSLIQLSARQLGRSDYSSAQIEAALSSAWGLDSQLISDKTYYLIMAGRTLAGCGGWSFRRTLFGSDSRGDRDSSRLDPAVDAAKIRAFFIHPNHARQGLGTQLLIHCERQAWDFGFTRLELGATLPGVRLYSTLGYVAGEPYDFPTGPDSSLTIIPMSKALQCRP